MNKLNRKAKSTLKPPGDREVFSVILVTKQVLYIALTHLKVDVTMRIY